MSEDNKQTGKVGRHADEQRQPPHYKLIVLAASVGGIPALGKILSTLPADFPVALAIVQHRTAKLPHLLSSVTS